ncbi:uncharacterized protein AMSG_01717, partial [Thecamonas trahens ATCC 50062]
VPPVPRVIIHEAGGSDKIVDRLAKDDYVLAGHCSVVSRSFRLLSDDEIKSARQSSRRATSAARLAATTAPVDFSPTKQSSLHSYISPNPSRAPQQGLKSQTSPAISSPPVYSKLFQTSYASQPATSRKRQLDLQPPRAQQPKFARLLDQPPAGKRGKHMVDAAKTKRKPRKRYDHRRSNALVQIAQTGSKPNRNRYSSLR